MSRLDPFAPRHAVSLRAPMARFDAPAAPLCSVQLPQHSTGRAESGNSLQVRGQYSGFLGADVQVLLYFKNLLYTELTLKPENCRD
jgi:hypothetical protein